MSAVESLGTAYIVDIYVSKAVSDAMNGKTMVRSCGFPHSHHIVRYIGV